MIILVELKKNDDRFPLFDTSLAWKRPKKFGNESILQLDTAF